MGTTISVSNIKWYLFNKMDFKNQDGWNSDFIHGLTLCGRIQARKDFFHSFYWYSNVSLAEALRSSPFSGRVCKNPVTRNHENNWIMVPAFHLKYSENTLEYMAGALSSGTVVEKDGLRYIKYTKKMIHNFKKWSIPVEHIDFNGSVWISPIWPTLFVPYMPKILGDKFVDIKKAAQAELYAIILWYAYSGTNFSCDAIPYLPSRRTVFYHYKSDNGALNDIEKMRIEKGLTSLDSRIVNCVHAWKSKLKESQKEKTNVCNNT
jgi:hypothetical protein